MAQEDASGELRLAVVPFTDAEGDDVRIVVSRRDGTRVSVIEPNPEGSTRPWATSARFVARDNILVSWGCGTSCAVTVLFRSTGEELATFGQAEVSPDGELAIAFDYFGIRAPGTLQVIDLGTGRVLASHPSADAWNTCRVRWEPHRIWLQRCNIETPRSVVVPRPR